MNAPPAENTVCTGKEVFPWVHIYYSGGLYWFVHTSSFPLSEWDRVKRWLFWSRGHLCGWCLGLRCGTEGKQAEAETVVAVPKRWESRWCPDWFSGHRPVLSHHLFLLVSEVCSGGLNLFFFGTPLLAAKALLWWALVTRMLGVWFMNGSHQEYGFWQQKQIMEEIEWSNLWPLPHH